LAPSDPPIDWRELERRVRKHLERSEVDEGAALAIHRLRSSMLSYLCTMLPPDEALDALSRFEESLWKSLSGFRWECPLRAWAYRLAHRAAIRIFREPHRRREERLPSSAASRLPASIRSSRSVSSGRHAGLELLRAELEPDDQGLLTLRVDRKMEWDEIAVVLGSNSAALRKRYERLTKRLQRMARNKGLVDDPMPPSPGRERRARDPQDRELRAGERAELAGDVDQGSPVDERGVTQALRDGGPRGGERHGGDGGGQEDPDPPG
jgi:RNA polymerase sigma-70 factor (ECF subfamily)